jgi:phosphate:Na+ symporter
MIFLVVGGLGLFFLGMMLMSNGLKQAAGQKLKNLLETLTKNRISGVLVGTLVTCLMQSSSATTVITIGLINAGLLTLRQSLGVILGVNIGTTITAWLVSTLGIEAFKITDYSMLAIGGGFLIMLVGRTQKQRGTGNIILGFGLLFLGIEFMKNAFGPGGFNIAESMRVQNALIWVGKNMVLAMLAGAFITMAIQSSSAFIAILQILAFQGAFGNNWDLALRVCIPFILGSNIGTTITAQLAAMQTSRDSKRAAMAHTVFNVLGTLYFIPLVWAGVFDKVVIWTTPWKLSQSTIMVHLAVAHTMFNVLNTIVFLPIVSWWEAIVMKLLPVTWKELAEKPVVLERHLFATPVLALAQAKREIIRMTEKAKEAVQQAVKGLLTDDERKLEKARAGENITDDFQLAITSYLVALSREQLSEEVSNELPVLLHTVNDLERVGDHAVNIAEIAERKIRQKITFSQEAHNEAAKLTRETDRMFERISAALENSNIEAAKSALDNERNINKMQVDFRRSHVQRMNEGICTAEAGLIFIDLVDNAEKIGDHLTNIAQAVIGGLQWDGIEPKKVPSTPPKLVNIAKSSIEN